MSLRILFYALVMTVAAILALVNILRVVQLQTTNDLLGLWDVDAPGKLRFPPQKTISGDQLPLLIFQKKLHLRATEAPVKRADLRAVLEDYGLEESNLDDVIRSNNLPPSPGVTDQQLDIPLNGP